jgi:hypothetical protein
VLEITALTALRRHKFAVFETCMDELRAHYACARTESPQMYMMLGLDLMYKLAFDKMKEFHLVGYMFVCARYFCRPCVNTTMLFDRKICI